MNIFALTEAKQAIDVSTLFGKDTQRLLDACDKVCDGWLESHKGCYFPYERIRKFSEEKRIPVGMALTQFFKEYPEEFEKRKASVKEWDEQYEKLFEDVDAIGQQYGFFLQWHGNGIPSYGDQWTVWSAGEPVARIQK